MLPMALKLNRSEIAKSRMDALVQINIVNETTDLAESIIEITIIGKIDLLFFECAHKAFGEAKRLLGWEPLARPNQ